jgi:uncharacterized OB-fold protein
MLEQRVGAVQSTSLLQNNTKDSKKDISVSEFQEAITKGRILGYVCKSCGHERVDLLKFCPKCGSSVLAPKEFGGTGRVLTYTVQRVATEEYTLEVPYAWVVVKLDDGPNVTGWIPSVASDNDLKIGQRVKARPSNKPSLRFEKVEEDTS